MFTPRPLLGLMLAATALTATVPAADACTRVVYHGADNIVTIGRSLDWKTPIPTNLWVYPRGIKKMSHDLPGAFGWTSLYGSVYAVSYDAGVTEGMNERGLTVNSLFCKGTQYISDATRGNRPVSLAVFVAWILDLNATTAEAVAMLRNENFAIRAADFDGGTQAAIHFAITDAGGESAIVEFIDGKMNIYEGPRLDVLTNDPPYPQMEAIEGYWEKKGGEHVLPGTVSSPDRFVRASFFDSNVAATADPDSAVAIVRSIVMNASVPMAYTVKGEPNLSSTQWRSVSDPGRLRYYFDIVGNLGVIYLDMTTLNLYPGAPVMRLDTSATGDLVGNVNRHLRRSEPFKPLY